MNLAKATKNGASQELMDLVRHKLKEVFKKNESEISDELERSVKREWHEKVYKELFN